MILEVADNAGGSGLGPGKVGLSESLLGPLLPFACLDNRPWTELQLKDKCTKNSFPSKLVGQSPKGQQHNKQVRTVARKPNSKTERIHVQFRFALKW